MIKIKDKEYSGNVFNADDDILTVVVYSDYSVIDLANITAEAKEIIEIGSDGTEVIYKVNHPVSASEISHHVFTLKYSTKQTNEEKITEQLEEQNEMIDTLLALILEG